MRRIRHINGVHPEASIEELRALKGEPKSRCWISEDKVTRVIYADIILVFDERSTLLEIREGSILSIDGQELKRGDPEDTVEYCLGVPDELSHDPFEEEPFEDRLRLRKYISIRHTLTVATNLGKVDSFCLKVNQLAR